MTKSLYDIGTALAKIEQELIDGGGELTDALEQRLDDTSLAFKDKVDGISKWMVNIDADVTALDNEIKRLQARKKVNANLHARLKEYIKEGMITANIKKMQAGTVMQAVAKNPPSVEVTDKNLIPAKFVTIEMVKTIKKAVLLQALKDGEDVPGAKLIDHKTHLLTK